MPVQVRFLEKIRSDGDGGMFAQHGSYLYFLNENGKAPPIAKKWKDYEKLFLESIAGENASLDAIRIRERPSGL